MKKRETLEKIDSRLNLSEELMREISIYVKLCTEIERDEQMNFIEDLPPRYKNKVAIFIYERHRVIPYLQICYGEEMFVKWVANKLNENRFLAGTFVT